MSKDEIVLFESHDKKISLTVHLEKETVWLSQSQMIELFGRDQSVISRHINNAFKEELDKKSNMHFLHIPNSDRPVAVYSLDVIISVGYRVKSQRGVEFRKWANSVLKDYILKGYAVNESRLQQLGEAVRLMRRTQYALDSSQVLTVVESFSSALNLLDAYDHQNMQRPKGSASTYVLSYEECRDVIDHMRFGNESEWPLLIVAGMHVGLLPFVLQQLSSQGFMTINIPNFTNNFSQGAACLGVAVKTKDANLKAEAVTCAITAVTGGISEPAIFGVCLQERTPLIASMIGNAVGGAIVGLTGCKMFFFTAAQ